MENDFGFDREEQPFVPPTQPKPFPRRVYGPNGAEKTVANIVEERALGEGWSRKRPPAPVVPSPADTATEMADLKKRVGNLEGALAELLAKKK